MPPIVPEATLVVFAALLAAGGTVGYAKAGSRASLIAGISSAFLALACLGVSRLAPPVVGYGLGVLLGFALLAFFTRRFTRTHAFMPAGMMAVVCLLAVVLLAASILR